MSVYANGCSFADSSPLKQMQVAPAMRGRPGQEPSQQQARGPGFNKLDSSIFKNFAFTESVSLQFRAEAFNTTNTPQFAQPGSLNFTNTKAAFSSITGTRADARRVQFALKLFY